MTPIIFTNGYLLNKEIAQKLFELNASVVLKWPTNGFDKITRVKGSKNKTWQAIKILMRTGFNKTYPTKMGIDHIIYNNTLVNLDKYFNFCRKNNIDMICSTFIPAGRTKKGNEQELDLKEIINIYKKYKKIDHNKYKVNHSHKMPYLGLGKTCIQYYGLYINIKGDIYDCPGQKKYFGNIKNISLENTWQEKIKLLKKYDNGCPPRKKYYLTKKNNKEFIKEMF